MMALLALIPAALITGFGLVVALALYWIWQERRARRTMLQALAERLGFEFVEAGSWMLRGTATAFIHSPEVLFRYHLRGPTPLRRSAHAESASERVKVSLGDMLDTSCDPSSEITLATAEDATLNLPIFCIEPRRRDTSLWFAAQGLEPIPMPEDPAFDEKYAVRGPDAVAVRRVLDDTVRRELLARPSYTVEGHDRTLMLFRDGSLLDAAQCERLLEDLKAIAALDWGRERQ